MEHPTDNTVITESLTYSIRLIRDTSKTLSAIQLIDADSVSGQSDQPPNVVCVIQDVTQRKQSEHLTEQYYNEVMESRYQLEEQSRLLCEQTEALQQANKHIKQSTQQKMDFITQMSHEIRTPLNGLIGLTQLLTDTYLTAEQLDLLDSIKVSSHALLNTINELLDFSKMEAGFFTLNPGHCSPRKAIRQACDVVSTLMQQKNLELVAMIDPNLPAGILGDEDRLQQVLVNLLSNACKYTNYGAVHLRVQSDTMPDNHVRITFSVKDTGIGIPEEKQPLLFQQFTQLHNPSDIQTPVHSTGLGLTICKTIVELMGGDIGAYSKPGEGSTFWFTFIARVEEPAVAIYLPFRQIVLVEENEAVRAYRHQALSFLGCQVITESRFDGILRHPLADAVVISYPFDDTDTDRIIAIVDELQTDGIPVYCLVHRRTRPRLPFSVTGLLYRPMNTDSLMAQLLHPVRYMPPSTPPNQPLTIPESTVIPMPMQGHVLVAEDNLVNQKVVTKFLDQLRYTYDVAKNGHQAVEAVKARHYDAILMDCQMPDMDGYEASRTIREQLGIHHIPIIALTAHALAGERQKCLDAGMNDYLTKPIAKQHLANMLAQYIQPAITVMS